MRPQSRPFVVETKRKRSHKAGGRSIWGDVDLSSFAVESTDQAEPKEAQESVLVDSAPSSKDAEDRSSQVSEGSMPETKDVALAQTEGGFESSEKTEPTAKKKTSQPRRGKAANPDKQPVSGRSAKSESQAGDPPSNAARAKRKVYSDNERAQKLTQIEKRISGGASIKSAVTQAGISEQTYYQWKKTAATTPVSSDPTSSDLKDILALEQENERLKKLLAERLRKENAELKRKLGLS